LGDARNLAIVLGAAVALAGLVFGGLDYKIGQDSAASADHPSGAGVEVNITPLDFSPIPSTE
jgi:hypothetical protein